MPEIKKKKIALLSLEMQLNAVTIVQEENTKPESREGKRASMCFVPIWIYNLTHHYTVL